MTDFSVENVIIGAGVVGLALGYHLSEKNIEILILEKENDFGKITIVLRFKFSDIPIAEQVFPEPNLWYKRIPR